MRESKTIGGGFSRRSFIKGSVALGATATLFGCTKRKEGQTTANTAAMQSGQKPVFRYGTSTHNCGGRCIIRAQMADNGRIVRFLTDETTLAFDGSPIGEDNRNTTVTRACARCRGYRGRLYHPGRLMYPLKQTKERGDVTGFQRITWTQALREITDRLKAVQGKYGPETFHSIYACGNIGSIFQGASYGIFYSDFAGTFPGQAPALRLLGGSTEIVSDYSFHQASYMGFYGMPFSGIINMTPTADDIAGVGKYVVLWGSNIPTTNNTQAFPWVKAIEDMKKRAEDSKVIFVGPELSESGLNIADEWLQIRPYTDTALILALLHEMLINTVKPDGSIAKDPWLDLNYLDTMVYGFFDSPEYYLNLENGQFSFEAADGLSKISKVPDGMSLSAYILGNDDRLTKTPYGKANYVAKTYSDKYPGITRNKAICKYKVPANTRFEYKKHIMVPKTAEWAAKITGISAARIKEMAKMYVDAAKSGQPIWNEWSGGQLKQAEGCVTLFAMQMLCIVSKNWGLTGTGVARAAMKRSYTLDPNQINAKELAPSSWYDSSIKYMPKHPRPSVVQWHNAIKFAFGDQLKANGYVPNIPDWKKSIGTEKATADGRVYHGDGGTKALVMRNLVPGSTGAQEYTVPGNDGITRTYYDFVGRDNANDKHAPVYSGFRYIFNSGGNIPINQHMNCIDSAEMYKYLPTHGYGKYAADMEDAFYLVTFDNFMSPSARYSDYVLPAKTAWEQEDFVTLRDNATMYIDSFIDAPGESMSTWDFGREWVKTYAGEEAASVFTGENANTTFRQRFQKVYNEKIKTNPQSPFHNKSWEQFLEKPLSHPKPSTNTTSVISKNPVRAGLDKYLSGEMGDIATTPFFANISSVDATTESGVYGFGFDEFAEKETCPNQSKRFHAYSGALQWRYENLFSKWHGYLPLEQQGQLKDDGEGSPVVYPIVMYYDYNDYFIEAYGLKSKADLNGRYLLTTTHDRFRAHSSLSENPYLRELTHRTVGGGLNSGNDAGYYAISNNPTGDFDSFPALNSMIGDNGLPTDKDIASYSEIWVNADDFAGMADGTLVKVENEIGAVYCTLRKTNRCVRGFVGLHQGCWYDPRIINGKIVDVGGNCNTLMASKPSRMDHGNAQQSAMVKITKVNL